MLHRRPLAIARHLNLAAAKPPQGARPTPASPSPVGDVLDALAFSPSPRLLMPEEVAAMLGVSERTLGALADGWRRSGFISLTRKTVRYTAAAIDAFIQERTKANTAQ